jgi:hypothetical protein
MRAASAGRRFRNGAACQVVARCVAALLLLGPWAAARAEDPLEAGRVLAAEHLLEVFATFLEADRGPEAAEAFPRLVEAHNTLRTEPVRRRILASLAEALDQEALGLDVRLQAADALGRVNDADGAWKHLKRHVPDRREEAAGPLPLRVLQAVGALAPDGALKVLTDLMEKAEDANVSRHAIQALGKYGWSKRRVKVLEALVDAMRRLRPGGLDPRKGRGGGEAVRERFAFLQETFVAALDELTGREIGSVDGWFAAVEAHRRDLEALFLVER